MISTLKLIKKIIILNIYFLIIMTSCSDKKNNKDYFEPEILSNEVNFEEPIDLSIMNILIYPNQFDKNSVYLDTEILSERGGEGDVQISLINDDKLVASHSIKIKSNISNYFQSFLISGNIDFDKIFELNISALKGEENISNNRYSFQSKLKIEKPKIAVISGKLNFNSPFIINNLNTEYDHFYPNPLDGNLDITNFWFNEYDILILDNFPSKPVSDKWLNLFLKKIYSEETSLIMTSRFDQNFNEIKNFFPIFGLNTKDNIDLQSLNSFSRFSKQSFKSSFIISNELYNHSENFKKQLVDTIDWILFDTNIQHSFFIANSNLKKNKSIFIYGYSNIVDLEIKNFNVELLQNDSVIDSLKLLYNPISGYYFCQLKARKAGQHILKIKENNKLIDTININIFN